MFDTLHDATHAMQEYFEPKQVQIVTQALVPVIEPQPYDDADIRPGSSRLGGLPDFAAGTEWPRPPLPADIELIARRGNKDAAAAMRAHLQANLPYTFMAQIDLQEAHRLGSVAAPLPADGRLLFFYDLSIGPWESGERTVRVIWDDAPATSLTQATMPADMAAAAERERREHEAILKEFDQPLPEGPLATNYGASAKPVRLRARLSPPDPHSLEFLASAELNSAYQDDEEFADDYSAMQEEFAADTTGWRSHLLLGSPSPEQDDPRYQAVVVTEFGEEFLDSETWKRERERIETLARQWRLLLQVDLADWSNGALGEGTVYFLIRTEDLDAKRFDRVVAVYQQT